MTAPPRSDVLPDQATRTATRRPVILLVGPTAGGKTRLGVELSERLPGGGVLIAADSMQVYRGMDVGTAKPTAEERARAEHLLIDVIEPDDETFSVERWLLMAREAIEDVRHRGAWPIVVGGTNLYVKALLDGLLDGPPPDAALRAELGAWPCERLRAELERVDPVAAERIHPADQRRTIRAIEVFRATGRPLSELQVQWRRDETAPREGDRQPADAPRDDSPGAAPDPMLIAGLEWPVDAINRRINARVRAMVDAGLFEEVEQLHRAGRLGRQAREALGYRQILDHLAGRLSREDAIEQIKIRSRRYAKQQRTWLKRFRMVPGVPSRFFPGSDESTGELPGSVLEWILERARESRDPQAIPRPGPGAGFA